MNEKAKYVEVSKEQNDRIDSLRYGFSRLYDIIEDSCKNSREKSLVFTKLEEAQFWAIKGISRE
jgi:hypothetical protein